MRVGGSIKFEALPQGAKSARDVSVDCKELILQAKRAATMGSPSGSAASGGGGGAAAQEVRPTDEEGGGDSKGRIGSNHVSLSKRFEFLALRFWRGFVACVMLLVGQRGQGSGGGRDTVEERRAAKGTSLASSRLGQLCKGSIVCDQAFSQHLGCLPVLPCVSGVSWSRHARRLPSGPPNR